MEKVLTDLSCWYLAQLGHVWVQTQFQDVSVKLTAVLIVTAVICQG